MMEHDRLVEREMIYLDVTAVIENIEFRRFIAVFLHLERKQVWEHFLSLSLVIFVLSFKKKKIHNGIATKVEKHS